MIRKALAKSRVNEKEMKKELPPAAIVGIAIVALIAIVGGGLAYFNKTTSTSEDPTLVQKQLEFERSKRPGGGAETQNTGNGSIAPQGFSPGRESEMEARQKGHN